MYNSQSVGSGTAASGSFSSMPGVPVETISPSRIRDGITHSEEVLSAVHDAIAALEGRLETVLQPQPPSTVGNAAGKQAGPPASHVMGRIAILNDGFEAAVARLRDLARRIEV